MNYPQQPSGQYPPPRFPPVHLRGTRDGGRPATVDLTVKRETDGSYCISSATSSF
ncbi:hypothetical protein ILP97_44150 [Amycolatopsis sp. H6(2020)]|nr:hypothetical protein [Amycolatopsis sp. H6(2020)]